MNWIHLGRPRVLEWDKIEPFLLFFFLRNFGEVTKRKEGTLGFRFCSKGQRPADMEKHTQREVSKSFDRLNFPLWSASGVFLLVLLEVGRECWACFFPLNPILNFLGTQNLMNFFLSNVFFQK